MGLGISRDHVELAATVARWAEARGALAQARAAVEAAVAEAPGGGPVPEPARVEPRPGWWREAAELGWFGLAVRAELGGQGAGLMEQAVVLEELGRRCTPGPVLSTAVAAAAIDRWGRAPELASALVDGTMAGGVALSGELLATRAEGGAPGGGVVVAGVAGGDPGGAPPGGAGEAAGRRGAAPVGVGAATDVDGTGGRVGSRPGAVVVSGRVAAVWGGAAAGRFVLPVAVGDRVTGWVVVDRDQVDVRDVPPVDATRGLAELRLDALPVAADRWLEVPPSVPEDGPDGPDGPDTSGPAGPTDPAELATLLAAAEALGVAEWCVRAAADHAADRVQFGRPIGQFQAVKHRCADMLVRLECARAAVWDALRCADAGVHGDGWPVAFAAAAALAPEAAFRAAQDCVQVLGGVGYTWEHDAHIYLKRATATRHLVAAPGTARAAAASAARAGVRRTLTVDLPPEAEEVRAQVRAFVVDLRRHERHEWRALLADHGYLAPHWPRPWGRDASAVAQVVIDQELRAARVRRPHLQVAGWVLPTLVAHGSADQQKRFVGPSLRGEIAWCQMFSEPGAGSDLASLTTRAERIDGGWSLTGQKVWTTFAHEADWGLCLARTDPDAPPHEGIGCFLVDMRSPGIDVRPLRELTGLAMFNEVFLTGVEVPDDGVVGAPTAGWACARTTLANERVSMASGSSFGPGVRALLDLAATRGAADDPLVADGLGGLVVEAHALAALGLRATLRAVQGDQPGPEASVRKLASAEHDQAVQEAGLALLGPEAASLDGPGGTWIAGFLGNRALTIAGGTSEIQRNVIAERLLGLPRDP